MTATSLKPGVWPHATSYELQLNGGRRGVSQRGARVAGRSTWNARRTPASRSRHVGRARATPKMDAPSTAASFSATDVAQLLEMLVDKPPLPDGAVAQGRRQRVRRRRQARVRPRPLREQPERVPAVLRRHHVHLGRPVPGRRDVRDRQQRRGERRRALLPHLHGRRRRRWRGRGRRDHGRAAGLRPVQLLDERRLVYVIHEIFNQKLSI